MGGTFWQKDGAPGDAHFRSEVSRACCGLRFVLEALWRMGRVYIYRHLRAELLQLTRVVTRYVAVLCHKRPSQDNQFRDFRFHEPPYERGGRRTILGFGQGLCIIKVRLLVV